MKIKTTNNLSFNEDGLSKGFTFDDIKGFGFSEPRMVKKESDVKEMVVQPKRKQSKSVTLF